MKLLNSIVLALAISSCTDLFPPEKERPLPKKVATVVRCNKFGTCLVRFDTGENGLMTRPSEGDYACQSINSYAFNKCPGPDERPED